MRPNRLESFAIVKEEQMGFCVLATVRDELEGGEMYSFRNMVLNGDTLCSSCQYV